MLTQGLLLATLTLSSFAIAQKPAPPPPAGSNWQHVQALPMGTYVHVSYLQGKVRTRRLPCTLKAIDADTLTCIRETGVGRKDVVFQRPEITAIKLAHRGRSALAGAGIGAGAGALVGGIEGLHNHYFAVRGAFALIGAFAGLFAGAPTGYLTDFTASTIYCAPRDGLATQKGGHGYK
jgi:hypothetical protein